MTERIQFNPGPVMLSDAVRRSVARIDISHRSSDFTNLQRELAVRVSNLVDANVTSSAVFIPGSSTYALESACVGFSGESNLVISNGVYGDRLAEILRYHKLPTHKIGSPLGRPLDYGEISEHISSGAYDTVLMVHHETSSGMLNDISQVFRQCEAAGLQFICDAISSIGAEPIRFGTGKWALVGSSNKCIESIPGAPFVVASSTSWSQPLKAGSYSLSLERHYNAQASGSCAFTPMTNSMLALDTALEELQEEGVDGRRARYARHLGLVTDSMQNHGLTRLVKDGEGASSLAAFRLPPSTTFKRLERFMDDLGITIYGAQSDIQPSHFRISVMGSHTDNTVKRLSDAFNLFMRKYEL
jgi:2-aminoethylphosphonate-pyruvate transaminase